MASHATNRIAELRNNAGLTQQALADAVGTHWITISKLERGRMRLTLDWMHRLAPHLNADASAIIALDNAANTAPQNDSLERAFAALGNRSALARAIGVKPQALAQWTKVPSERVLQVEEATGVSRHELRPDIYPSDEAGDTGGVQTRLKEARESAGFLTAKDAAQGLNVPYGTYSGHESGTRGIKRPDIIKYAAAFRVEPAWLEFGAGDLPAPRGRVTPTPKANSLIERLRQEESALVEEIEALKARLPIAEKELAALRSAIGHLAPDEPSSETDAA